MKRLIFAVILCSVFIFSTGSSLAESEQGAQQVVKLTEEQQAELAALYDDVFNKHEQIIKKYVEFGVFPQEKGEKILKHMEERHEKLKENGYIPTHDRHHKPKSTNE